MVRATDLYGHDYFIVPDFRAHGVLAAMHSAAIKHYARDQMKNAIMIIIEASNRRSIRACTRIGFRLRSRHCAISAFGYKRVVQLK